MSFSQGVTRHSVIRKSISAYCLPFTLPICRASPAGTAFELLFSGRTFAAPEAYELGLVSKVVPDTELDAAADALAADFAAKSPRVMRAARLAFMRQNDDRRRIADAVEDFCDVATTEAAQEGIRAFLEKRAPRW